MGLYDAWLDFRDKCLTSERFHAFALRFPLTRPIVRKRQSEVFDIVSGFIYSQILFACIELGLLDHPKVKSPGATLADVSEITGLGIDEARRLAKGAASLRILEERNGRFRLGDLGAALSTNQGALAMIRHHDHLYRDLADPLELLKSGRQETHLSRYWDYARNVDPKSASPEEVSLYSDLMSASQDVVSDEVIVSFDFSPFKSLLDLGGGQGTFLNNVANAVPSLELNLFDLPPVVDRARELQETGKISDRIMFHGGSFFDGNLPRGSDLISLVRILHDHDDEPVNAILAAAFEALPAGGVLLIAEPMSTGGYASRIADAYFNFYLYAMGSGRPRSIPEYREMLHSAGFGYVKRLKSRSAFTTSILYAQKSS